MIHSTCGFTACRTAPALCFVFVAAQLMDCTEAQAIVLILAVFASVSKLLSCTATPHRQNFPKSLHIVRRDTVPVSLYSAAILGHESFSSGQLAHVSITYARMSGRQAS